METEGERERERREGIRDREEGPEGISIFTLKACPK
jgi:hypothetical protein